MKYAGIAVCMVAGTILAAAPAFAQSQGEGQAVITVLPHQQSAALPIIPERDLALKVNGKDVQITQWAPVSESNNNVELVLLIDDSSRMSLGRVMGDMEAFIRGLPPNVKSGIAYMKQGRADFAGPLTTDHDVVLKNLHLPGGTPGSQASPYFCLSDLAKRWPSKDPTARRIVVMLSDGVDYYQLRYDPQDPYVMTAINDSLRARLVVNAIYWLSQGFINTTTYENNAGQNLLLQVASATGGKSYWQGMGNPVTIYPYFNEIIRSLQYQYQLRFNIPLPVKPEIANMKLRLKVPGSEVIIPQQVYIRPAQQE
jgi:hypothetical protein